MGSATGLVQSAIQTAVGRGVTGNVYDARTNPFGYDPYTAARRPNYMTFGPNQQFYQPIYQPRYEQQFRTMDQMYQMPTYTRPLTPQPMQSQYRPIPYMTQTQIDARQRAAEAAAAAAALPSYDYGGGYGDAGFGGNPGGSSTGGGYVGPGSVGPEGQNASPGDGPGEGYGVGGDSSSGGWGEGVFKRGGKVRRPSYGGIDSLLRK